MRTGTSARRVSAIIVGVALIATVEVIRAQQGSIAAMYNDDQQRAPSLAPSFATLDMPATSANVPLRVYLSAGDLERAFDRAEFRPDATIIPTNTDLQMTAGDPATLRVLVSRVQKQPDVMRDLESQI